MANTKVTILDAIATLLNATSGITTATRDLKTPSDARAAAPYVGILSSGEGVLVEDSTHIRYAMTVDLILNQSGDSIEELVDIVRNAMLASGVAAVIGAKEVRLLGVMEVNLVNADDYSSARMQLQIIYASQKGIS